MSRLSSPPFCCAVAAGLTLGLSGVARADDSVQIARKHGFTSCDEAIRTEMKSYDGASNGRINITYNDELIDRMIALTATYGVPGDSVFSTVTFLHDGATCWSVTTSSITSPKQCIQYKEDNPVWKYVETQADFTWTANAGGVTALLKSLPAGGCLVTWPSITHKYAATSSPPSNLPRRPAPSPATSAAPKSPPR